MASHHAGGVADETLPLLAKPAAGASSAWHDAGTFGGASAGASADASSSSSSSSSSSLAFDPLDHLSVLAWMFYDVAWTQEWKHVLWPFLLTAACFTHAIFLARNDAMEFPHACATAAWLVGGNGAWTYMDYHPGIASDSTKLAAWRAAAIGFLALPIAIEAFVLARIRRRQRGAGGGGGRGGGGKKGAMYERHKAAAAAASVSAEKPPPATATATATAGVVAGMTDAFTASAIAAWAAVDLVNFLTEIRDGRDGGQDVGASVADAASCAAWAALAAVVVAQTAYFLWRRYKNGPNNLIDDRSGTAYALALFGWAIASAVGDAGQRFAASAQRAEALFAAPSSGENGKWWKSWIILVAAAPLAAGLARWAVARATTR